MIKEKENKERRRNVNAARIASNNARKRKQSENRQTAEKIKPKLLGESETEITDETTI